MVLWFEEWGLIGCDTVCLIEWRLLRSFETSETIHTASHPR